MNICIVGIMLNRPPQNKLREKSSRLRRGGENWCWFELDCGASFQHTVLCSCALLRVWQEPFLPVKWLTGSGLGDICFGHIFRKANIGGSKSLGLLGSCFSVWVNSNKKWFFLSPVQSGLLSAAALQSADETSTPRYSETIENLIV